jgi:hypothetical protein
MLNSPPLNPVIPEMTQRLIEALGNLGRAQSVREDAIQPTLELSDRGES